MKLNYYSYTRTLPEPIIDDLVNNAALSGVVDSGLFPSRVKLTII